MARLLPHSSSCFQRSGPWLFPLRKFKDEPNTSLQIFADTAPTNEYGHRLQKALVVQTSFLNPLTVKKQHCDVSRVLHVLIRYLLSDSYRL